MENKLYTPEEVQKLLDEQKHRERLLKIDPMVDFLKEIRTEISEANYGEGVSFNLHQINQKLNKMIDLLNRIKIARENKINK